MTNENFTIRDVLFILNNKKFFEGSIVSIAYDNWNRIEGNIVLLSSYEKEYDNALKLLDEHWDINDVLDNKQSILKKAGFSSKIAEHMTSYFDIRSQSVSKRKKKFKILFNIFIGFLILILFLRIGLGSIFISAILPELRSGFLLTLLVAGVHIILLIVLAIKPTKVGMNIIGIVTISKIIFLVQSGNITRISIFLEIASYGILYYLFMKKK